MYIPLTLRLALFYTLIVGLACWFFGSFVYNQAEQQAYQNLKETLQSRAASVRFVKTLLVQSDGKSSPAILSGVDAYGSGGVSIEVLAVDGDHTVSLLATTDASQNTAQHPIPPNQGESPVPWDRQALEKVRAGRMSSNTSCYFSTVEYRQQHIEVCTMPSFDVSRIIQAARSTADIEQSLDNLRLLLMRGALLVMVLAFLGGCLLNWSVLAGVRRLTRAARTISEARDFSKRVQHRAWLWRDELATLAGTFNTMLASLEEVYKRQQRFVADASHELRAPITAIRCNLDLLAKAPDLPAEEAQGALADARAEAERMGRLVNDLLLLARSDSINSSKSEQSQSTTVSSPSATGGSIYGQEIDLDSLLLEVFRQYRPRELREDAGDDRHGYEGPRLLLQHITPVQVRGDADRLKQALVALVDNALKYTPHEGTVSLALSAADGYACVQVSDTGIGIFPEDLPHIFERFYRADRARTRDRGGSGLGLAIAQSIIHEHGGSIAVESTAGKGSTFTIKLPCG